MEMPDLAEYSAALPENVQLITLCLDGDINGDRAAAVLSDSGFDGVTMVSGDGDLEKLYDAVMYTPTTIAVDSGGNIIGDAIIGAPRNMKSTFDSKLNKVLEALGKETLNG